MDIFILSILGVLATIASLIPIITIAIVIVVILALKKALAKDQTGKVPKRSTSNKIIGGVCGGIAERLNINPTIIRCIWALAMFLAGTGLMLYIICWIVIPKETSYT